MGALKKLAGETAIYGLSSIVGRLINYLLVPLHTKVFFSEDMGIITGLYAFVALINIIFTAGMETAYFRFSKKFSETSTFKVAYVSVAVISLIGASLIFWQAEALAA
jgi:O-antigen/teichoic acid export membrane protein